MRPIHCFNKARAFLVAAAVLIASLGFVAPVFAGDTAGILNPDGKLTYLGTLGGVFSRANGINDAGQVVGYSSTDAEAEYEPSYGRAFITGPNGVGMTDLGTLGGAIRSAAQGINDAGQVVGYSYMMRYGHSQHAFITGPNGVGMTDLGTLGGKSSYAQGINDAGQVVGSSDTVDGSEHAFITGSNGVGMTDLGTLGGAIRSAAYGLNDAGQVVGYSYTVGDDYNARHAFITGPNGVGMTDLGTLGGNYSYAQGINDAGQVVGSSRTADDYQHAFVTGPNGVGMTDLGTLGGNYSSAYDINDAGQVVGNSETADNFSHAFITGPNGVGMTDLNSLVSLPGGTYISEANGINNHGQISVMVTAVPEPETYAMLLAGLALISFSARLRKTA